DHRIVLVHAGELLPVEDTGEWLADRSLRWFDLIRNPVDAIHRQDLGRDSHELGESAGVVVADGLQVFAHGLESTPTLEARSVGDGGDDLHAVAHAPRVDPGADLHDLAGDLVPHDPWQGDVGMTVAEDLDVRPARAAGKDANHQVSRAGHRLRERLEPKVTRRVQA